MCGTVLGSGGTQDYVVTKYSSTGDSLWTQFVDRGGADVARKVATDVFGDVIVTGSSSVSSTGNDCYTVKYSSSGQLQWAQAYNAYANLGDNAYALAVDVQGNVYIGGQSWTRSNGNSSQSIVTLKYGPGGSLLWAGHRSQYPDCMAQDITVDALGNVYTVGYEGSFSNYEKHNMVLMKYSPSGALQWTALYNGPSSNEDFGRSVAVARDGSVYITGESYSTSSGYDIMVLKYSPAGSLIHSVRYDRGINGDDKPSMIRMRDDSTVVVVGTSSGATTSSDIAVLAYDSTLKALTGWPYFYDGPAHLFDGGTGLCVDSQGIYVCGTSDGGATFYDIVTIKLPNGVSGCCVGARGNVNCTGIIDLGDLSALVSYLTGGGFVLCCYDAANVNGVGVIDLGDLSALVSYLTGGGFVLPNCP